MIKYEEFTLDNGLEVIVHPDHTNPFVVLNVLYRVGSRDEEYDVTGFAHLFEHLMFGGSKNIESYDEPVQRAGGNNNAFTSPDITNYYLTLPAANAETAFWLESDRMLSLSFKPEVLEVQRKVVIEEFKQRYLNQPYGDVWLKLRPLAYKQHPYRWATIGREISHIEQATMEQVRSFFRTWYVPNNAVLVIAGDITVERARELAEKYFAPIPAGELPARNYEQEAPQTEERVEEVTASVPADALYMAFHMPARTDTRYYTADLLSDVLGRGKSSRLIEQLVEKEAIFSTLNCYVTGSADPGLLCITGRTHKGISLEEGKAAVWRELNKLLHEQPVSDAELEKVKLQAEASMVFGQVELLNRAMNLAFANFLGDTELVNKELELVQAVTAAQVNEMAHELLKPENSNVLLYKAE